MLRAFGLRTFARCVVASLKYTSIVELTAGDPSGEMTSSKASKEMLNPSSMVRGGSVRVWADALGHFNWENLPRKAIFRRYCEVKYGQP